tara:strand:- start:2220 stop:3407 length:1188 start_codon:yes stop_codon:yes gene_type:complete
MAKPVLSLIPATQGSKLYSVLPENGVGDFIFTRSSEATRINKDGFIKKVGIDSSRLSYPSNNGVISGCPNHLLEPSRTNLIPYSEDFTQWSKSSGTSVVPSQVISPDEKLGGDKVIFSSANQTIEQSVPINLNAHTVSVYIKGTEGETIRLVASGTGSDFTLTGKWQRVELTRASAVTAGNFIISTFGGVTAREVFLWGAQLEEGGYATSYIPNYGSVAGIIRASEAAFNSGDATIFNSLEGTLMVEIFALSNDSTIRSITISGSTSNDVISIGYDTPSNSLTAFLFNGAYQSIFTTEIYNITKSLKVAFAYKLNEFKLYVNGLQVGSTDVSGAVASGLDTLSFDDASGSGNFYGSVRQLKYFDSALTSLELEELTDFGGTTDESLLQNELQTTI